MFLSRRRTIGVVYEYFCAYLSVSLSVCPLTDRFIYRSQLRFMWNARQKLPSLFFFLRCCFVTCLPFLAFLLPCFLASLPSCFFAFLLSCFLAFLLSCYLAILLSCVALLLCCFVALLLCLLLCCFFALLLSFFIALLLCWFVACCFPDLLLVAFLICCLFASFRLCYFCLGTAKNWRVLKM